MSGPQSYPWGGVGGARKVPMFLPLSQELVNAAPSTADVWRAAMSAPRRTPEERQAEIERRNAEACTRHRALVALTDGTVRRIVEHHAPEPMEHLSGPYCAGCDAGPGYREDDALWPCSTFLMVEETP